MTRQVSRRTALIATASSLLSCRVSNAAENALFWTVTAPGHSKSTIMFGYERYAAAAFPDIVRDGEAMVAVSHQVVMDIPQNVQLPAIRAATSDLKPIRSAISPQTAARLRRILAATHAASMDDREPGITVVFLLTGEGGHYANTDTIAGTILDYARSLGRPVDQLISAAEVRSGWQPPDLVALINSIGDDAITYLPNLRDRVGPIGSYLDRLYGQRRAEEWLRAQLDITHHTGVFLFGLKWAQHLKDLWIERAARMLMHEADEVRFMFFELNTLISKGGLLEALKLKGMVVAPLA